MPSKHGEQTGRFGCWLTQYIKGAPQYCNHLVYYDHGKRDYKSNVVAIKGFFGDEVRNKNRLADIDLIVAKPNKDIILLAEIEEKPGYWIEKRVWVTDNHYPRYEYKRW